MISLKFKYLNTHTAQFPPGFTPSVFNFRFDVLLLCNAHFRQNQLMYKNDSEYFFSCPGNIVVIRCRILFAHLFWNCRIWVAVFFQNGFRQKICLEFLCLNCELFSLSGCFSSRVGFSIELSQRLSSSLVLFCSHCISDLLTHLAQKGRITKPLCGQEFSC